MDFVGGTIDVFGSLPDIVVHSRELGLVVGSHDLGHTAQRKYYHGSAHHVVCQPVHNVAVRMCGDGIHVWRCVHFSLLSWRQSSWEYDLPQSDGVIQIGASPSPAPSIIAGMTMEHYARIGMWLAAQYQAMRPAPA